MPKSSTIIRAVTAALLLAGLVPGKMAWAADCGALLSRFNAAVQARSIEDAKKAEAEIGGDAVCGASLIQVQNTRGALQLVVAEALPPNSPQREALLVDADKP